MVCYFVMMVLVFGIVVFGGLFMLLLFMGVCMGGCVGLMFKASLFEAWDI